MVSRGWICSVQKIEVLQKKYYSRVSKGVDLLRVNPLIPCIGSNEVLSSGNRSPVT